MTMSKNDFSRVIDGAHIVIDRLNRDSLALACLLTDLGGRASIATTQMSVPADLSAAVARAAHRGVEVRNDCNLNACRLVHDVLVVDSYTSPLEPFVRESRGQGKLVTTLADIVMRLSPARSLAVTGSAGKSTTTFLLRDMLSASGLTVYTPRDEEYSREFAENPFPNFELVEDLASMSASGLLVVELTSSHLEYMHVSPNVAVVTTISPDHGEWHGSIEAYYDAKGVILRHQSADDWAVLNHDDPLSLALADDLCDAKTIHFSSAAQLERGVFINGEEIVSSIDGERRVIAGVGEMAARKQYLPSVLAASAAALVAGANPAAIRDVIRTFRGLRQRLEFVGRIDGAAVFNDGMAQTPNKTLYGLESFPDGSLVLISGGERRVEGFTSEGFLHSSAAERERLHELCKVAASKVRRLIVLGEGGRKFADLMLATGYPSDRISWRPTLRAAVHEAVLVAEDGDTVLLSPLYHIDLQEVSSFNTMILEDAREAGRVVEPAYAVATTEGDGSSR